MGRKGTAFEAVFCAHCGGLEAGDSAGAVEVGNSGAWARSRCSIRRAFPCPWTRFWPLYVWNDKRHFWLYCLIAAAGSAIGGLLPYGLGRAGGELFLLKRVNRAKFEQAARPLPAAGVPGRHDSLHDAAAGAVEGLHLRFRRL